MLATLVIIALGLLLGQFGRQQNPRHRRNIERSRTLLAQLRGFAGEGRQGRMIAYLRRIDPLVFEETVLTAFEAIGYKVVRNRRYTGDGGVDGHVIIDGRRVPIQAKRYAAHIDHEHVRAFSRHAERVGLGLFIHTGRTGEGAWDARRGTAVQIISGQRLVALIDGVDPLHKK